MERPAPDRSTAGRSLRARVTAEVVARIGIVVELMALIRCLGEYYRLKHLHGAHFDPLGAEPFILGALVAAVFCFASVLLYFARKWRWSASMAGGMLAALLLLKFALIER